MAVRIEVTPLLLEWARVRAGLSDDALERRFPLYRSWSTGLASPTLRQLEQFARSTHTPLGFFFLEEPPEERVPIPDFRTMGDRAIGEHSPVVSADLLDVIYACQSRQAWYRDHQLLNAETPLAFVSTATLADPIGAVADEIRTRLDWSADRRASFRSWDAALTHLRVQAEAAGVLVMISGVVGSNTHRKLDPQEFRGFALVDPYAALVFVNGADSKAAQVFTLAHELAHLWIGETALSDIEAQSTHDNAIERWCNQVAAEFLVPIEEFRNVFDPRTSLRAQLGPLAEHFRVSTQVILGQAREAGLLNWTQYLAELDHEKARVAEFAGSGGQGGNYYNTKPVQISRRFARAVVGSALEGRTPYTQAFRLLDVKKAGTFDQLAERLGVA